MYENTLPRNAASAPNEEPVIEKTPTEASDYNHNVFEILEND